MDIAMDLTWMDVLLQVIKILAGLVASVGIPYIVSVIKKYIKNDKINEYIERADDYLSDAVLMVTQTFVDNCKKEGKFDAEAQKKAFQMAADAWLAMMSDEMKKIILKEVGDLETYIKTKIESKVKIQKDILQPQE